MPFSLRWASERKERRGPAASVGILQSKSFTTSWATTNTHSVGFGPEAATEVHEGEALAAAAAAGGGRQ